MKPRMLVVLSSESTRFAMQRYFDPLGFEIVEARSRLEAENALAGGQFAVVLTELQLEKGRFNSGLEVVVTARLCQPETPVILLATFAARTIVSQANGLGARAVLDKPQSLDDIAQVVTRLQASSCR